MRILIIAALSLIASSSYAQNAWSLERCVEYALQNNIQIQQNQLNVELAEENLLQAKGNLLPNLNAGATHGYNWGQRIDPFTNQFATDRVRSNNFFISSSATLFSGFTNVNSVKREQYNVEATKSDAATIEKNTSLTIAATYLQILFNEELLEAAKNQRDITQQQLSRTQKLVDAGQLARNSALDIEAQLANESLNVVNAENNLNNSILSLKQLLQLSNEQANEFKISRPNLTNYKPTAVSFSSEIVYQAAVENQPEVQSADYRVKSADKSIEIAKGLRSPSISVSGSAGSGYSGLSTVIDNVDVSLGDNPVGITSTGEDVFTFQSNITTREKPFGDQFNDNLNQNLNFNLSIPIFNGFSTKSSISSAIINKKNAELALESQKNQIKQDIQTAHADAIAAFKRFEASKKSRTAFKESFKYAELRYQQKLINSVDYNYSKNKLAQAESDLIQAKYDYIFKNKILSFYMGEPLKL